MTAVSNAKIYVTFYELEQVWINQLEFHPSDERAKFPFWASGLLYDLEDEQPELLWEFIRFVCTRDQSDDTFANLGSGPLESLIAKFGTTYIERVEQEARRNVNFKRALSSVWQNTMSDELFSRVEVASGRKLGNMPDRKQLVTEGRPSPNTLIELPFTEYNDFEWRVEHDREGRPIKTTVTDLNGKLLWYTTNEYDEHHRLLSYKQYDSYSQLQFLTTLKYESKGKVFLLNYDSDGNLICEQAADESDFYMVPSL